MHRDENFHRTLTIPHAPVDDARPATASLAAGWTWTERRGQTALSLAEPMRELADRASADDAERRQRSWIDAALTDEHTDLLVLHDPWGVTLAAFVLELRGDVLRVSEVAVTGEADARRKVAAVALERLADHMHADHASALAVDSPCVEDLLHEQGWVTGGYAGQSHHIWRPSA